MALIEIQGVEVTQAIQYYNSAAHLTDTADQQPDNSVTLVAGKPRGYECTSAAAGLSAA